jgi:hypothetical protein
MGLLDKALHSQTQQTLSQVPETPTAEDGKKKAR